MVTGRLIKMNSVEKIPTEPPMIIKSIITILLPITVTPLNEIARVSDQILFSDTGTKRKAIYALFSAILAPRESTIHFQQNLPAYGIRLRLP